MVGRMGGRWLGLALLAVTGLATACSDDAADEPATTTAGSAGNASQAATAAGDANGGKSAESGGSSSGASGALPSAAGAADDGPVSWMTLPDDASGITGLEDCALAQAGHCVKPLDRSHAELCQRWNAERPQRSTALQMPAASDCDPGTTVDPSIEDALRRLNLFRWISGAGPLAIDEDWNAHARACAVIQSYLTPEISHYPEDSARCFTEQGYSASGQSMLAGGSINPSVAVDDLIFDTGDNNFHVLGHRQGMLNPQLRKVGIGFAEPPEGSPATCVRMFDDEPLDATHGLEGIYTFPGAGRSPWEAVAHSIYAEYDDLLEWSLTAPPDVDVSDAKVRLVHRGERAWQEVSVTSGPFVDDRFHGLWIIPGAAIEPGVYAVIVSGSSLETFGYQLLFDQCSGAPTSCDVLEQDCGDGLGCYDAATPYCREAGKLSVGEACRNWDNAECEAGATCALDFAGHGYFCSRYCDPTDAGSERSCDKLCPNLYNVVTDVDGSDVAGAYCFGGVGDACDPLAPSCKGEQSCFGFDPPLCQSAGSTAVHEECGRLGGTCAPGATCVGLQGASKLYCQPYCDPAASAHGDKACGSLCPDNFWTFDGFGLCIPPE